MKPRETVRGLAVVAMAIVLVSGAIGSSAHGQTTRQAQAAVPPPLVQEEVVQNNPDGKSRNKIHNRIITLIKGAKPKSDITIASYRFDHDGVADALVEALGDEVRVRILLDAGDTEHSDSGQGGSASYWKVKNAMASSPGSWIKDCGDEKDTGSGAVNKRTSCMGAHIMHNKFYLFEHTNGSDKVVLQTSANLSSHSGPNMWNTAYIVPNSWLYGKYMQYFDDLEAYADPVAGLPDYYHVFQVKHPPISYGKFKFYPSPRKEGNTFYNILGNVKCFGNTSGGTEGNHRTIVRVAAAQIKGKNGIKIAKRLKRLDDDGCYVDVVADAISKKAKRDGKKGALEALLARPKRIPLPWPPWPAPRVMSYHGPEVREFSKKQCGVHQKDILIDGYYAGKKNRKVVFTGSHNLNNKSPRYNDEVILRIEDDDIHKEFKKKFFKIRDAAAITWQTSKYPVDLSKHKFCRD